MPKRLVMSAGERNATADLMRKLAIGVPMTKLQNKGYNRVIASLESDRIV